MSLYKKNWCNQKLGLNLIASAKKILKEIEEKFAKKQKLLEHFKTYNSSIVNAVPYLFDITQAIKKEKILNLDELNILSRGNCRYT